MVGVGGFVGVCPLFPAC